VDGKVYLGNDAGDLYVFTAARMGAPPRRIHTGAPVKVPTVAANGVLYVNTGSTLYAVKK
jgi:hypothetical protein